jgi:uncharacterized membrane protein YfcA
MAFHPLFALSGFLVGLLVGQTGMGGGALMTPLLVLVFGVHPSVAVGTDLLYACATKVFGTLMHGLNHSVDWRIVSQLAIGSVPATALTLIAIAHFKLNGVGSGHLISTVLGVMLLFTASALILRRRLTNVAGPFMTRVSPRGTALLTIASGVLLGVMVTISSVGAGALGVTALVLLYPDRSATNIVGSDIAHAVPLTLIAGLGHWWLGSVDWPLFVSLLTGSIPGIMLGSYLSVRLPEVVTRPVMAATLVLIASRLIL